MIFLVVCIITSQQIYLLSTKLEKVSIQLEKVYAEVWKSSEIPECGICKSLKKSVIYKNNLMNSSFCTKECYWNNRILLFQRLLWMPILLMQPCTEPQDFQLSHTVPALMLEQNQFCFRANIKLDKNPCSSLLCCPVQVLISKRVFYWS